MAVWPTSAGCASATTGWAIRPARSPRGATPAWSCAARPWPRPSSPLPRRGPPGARACRPARCPPRRHPGRGQRQRARGGDLARSHHAVPPRTGRAGCGQRSHLAHRRLLHGDVGLHRVAQRRVPARCRRAAAGAQQQRRALGGQPVAHLVPSPARRRRPDLRVERPDDPRQDGGGRSAVRARRLDEPEPVELDGQLGARRRHRAWRAGGARWRRSTIATCATRPRSSSPSATPSGCDRRGHAG